MKKGYILPHTHWDREWRYPIFKSRMLLVAFMEELLDILDTDLDYHCFLMDGQSVPIEDYLEIRPDDEERVRKYVKDGRILIGPWYTLPDLYPIGGESLVRNLLKGTRVAKKYGKSMNVGYNSFGWGQTAQLPQIYAGFGIDFIICAKKVSNERASESEFFWESPDGTRILTSRLGTHARANFYFNAYLKARYGIDCLSEDFKYDANLSGMAVHNSSEGNWYEDYFMVDSAGGEDGEMLKEGLIEAWKCTDDTVFKNNRLFLNGTDFSTPHRELSVMIKELNDLSRNGKLDDLLNGVEFENADLESYAKAIRADKAVDNLRVIKGELRDGPACDCSGNALASRVHLKQLNKKAQNLLINQAEPFISLCRMAGGKDYQGFLNKAWEYLLKAHPHDSINGVTQDKTADDTQYRLEQAIEIGQVLVDEAAYTLARNIDLSDVNKDEQVLLLMNPHPYPISEVIKVNIDTPQEMDVWSLVAKDVDGKPLMLQEISRSEKVYPVHDMYARPWPYACDRHECYLETGEIPALGYKVVLFAKEKDFKRTHFYWLPMRQSIGEDICNGVNMLENEFLKANINSNGTIDLIDKEHGMVYDGLHYFEDAGDVGNYWAYYPPYHNRIYTTLNGHTTTWIESNGSLSATIGIKYVMELPVKGYEAKGGVKGESKRSEEAAPFTIISYVTLHRGSRRLDIKTRVDNTAENHRLRVAFPTGIKAEYACAQGHFTVDERPVVPVKDANGKFDPEMQTLPMQNFVDFSDGKKGMAILADSLSEYEATDDENRTAYLTLFRAMGNMIVTWWEAVGEFPTQDGSQLQQKMEFNYSIYPHQGDWQSANVYRESENFAVKIMSYQMSGGKGSELPRQKSFVRIGNENLILSAFKKAEDREAFILRLYNPTKEEIKDTIQMAKLFDGEACVCRCNLNEEREEEILKTTGEIKLPVSVGANKIVTYEICK